LTEGEENEGTISEQMVRSVEHYPSETIVVVIARVRKAPKRVKNATVHDYELEVWEVHKVTELTENVPFTVYDAENINRDREDIDDDEDDDSSMSGLYPSNADTPAEGTPKVGGSPKTGTPRGSTDLSRVSLDSKARVLKDNLVSRSKYTFPKSSML
jgi:ergosteryl-3beta-O-L-aspartate synthase